MSLFAAAFRFWDLGIKPPHFDEGINGHFVQTIWSNGYYKYDPTNFHGPAFFYLLQIAELLFGRSIQVYRGVTILLLVGVMYLVYRHKKWLGAPALWATFILAVSPAFTFYSRYAIHEMLFILGQVAVSYGVFTWYRDDKRRGYIWMVTGVVILLATKETFFIYLGTVGIALAMVSKMPGRFLMPNLPSWLNPKRGSMETYDAVFISLVGVFAVFALFTGFFQYLPGAVDFFRAFAFWSNTGSGATGHSKMWYYWIYPLMQTYELWALPCVLISGAVAFWPKPTLGRAERFMALIGFGTFAAYSIIPYKTPWLILNMLWPLAFMPGLFFQAFNRWAVRSLQILVAMAIGVPALITSISLNFYKYETDAEPYVYVQTTNQFKAVTDVLEAKRKKYPEIRNLPIAILNRDTWPLPWVLGNYRRNMFSNADNWKMTDETMLILIDAKDQHSVESRLAGQWYQMPFQIRHSYDQGFAYLKYDIFSGYVPSTVKLVTGGKP